MGLRVVVWSWCCNEQGADAKWLVELVDVGVVGVGGDEESTRLPKETTE